ncbi:hypothetical protein NBRC3293_0724 [Gluconobacter oxydans NBRC 3293]|uniref:Uncharacterized protein n=1 Tax=Gluconobacter oxydans NBRC 3293 TaxID=1315969 RepID=A0A829WHF2_GLUOY|nr:hypothetical protein NBRC3293_0724 [Gluconobacter oxydans NBRC 3293]
MCRRPGLGRVVFRPHHEAAGQGEQGAAAKQRAGSKGCAHKETPEAEMILR